MEVRRLRSVIVDDNDEVLFTVATLAEVSGFGVKVATGVDSALKMITETRPDLVIVDLDLKDPKGRSGVWLL